MQPILEVQSIGKKFSIQHQRQPYLSIRDSLAHLFSKNQTQEDFWALRNVSFNVMPGESIGIIGKNGAGKSTLLKILSKITPPSTGKITCRGRIASLLEVGTGFHPELTGRENIYLNGSILGLKKTEITKQFDAITAFSGVENFLDTPLKHYSSGMQLRLAFAVAAHLEPDILIIDEVLAVGDADFQKKCMGKMNEVSKNGRTILFVSHNMGQLESLCSKAFILENGISSPLMQSSEAIKQYLQTSQTKSAITNHSINASILIEQFAVHSTFIYSNESVKISLALQFASKILLKSIALLLYNSAGVRIGIIDLRNAISTSSNSFRTTLELHKLPLVAGTYSFGLYIDSDAGSGNYLDLICLDVLEKETTDVIKYHPNVRGIIDINHNFISNE
ncbi:ABC transporter ATP-binding protein [Cytophaga aurantiaca]|uniref:ABC transporter ATP-binding protein n=1 Tax=Cytophaga aurantiaca TaxID=29530 RepID=UPI00037587F7|nr:ABC transporter ATP-binding protein [Cytophaga aurantiaca]